MQSLIRRGRASINRMLDRLLAANELAWGLVYCHVVGWRTSTAPTASRPDGDI